MDDGNDFLVTLPSNSNMASHPDNEPASYTVKLATPISLQGEWEAALVSMQYTHNWVISDDFIFLRFIVFESDTNTTTTTTTTTTTSRQPKQQNTVPDFLIAPHTPRIRSAANILARHDNNVTGLSALNVQYKDTYIYPHHYASAQQLGEEVCRSFHLAFPNTKAKLSYFYNYSHCSGRFVANNAEIAILSLDTRIGDLLGHNTELISCSLCNEHGKELLGAEAIEELLNATSRTPVTMVDSRHWYMLDRLGRNRPKLKSVSSLWVYSDITKRQRVGDAQVPLLGIIPVHRAPAGERTHYCVNPVHFLGLSRTYIDTITIMLVTERGERIPFAKNAGDDTNVVCCIRFRRCKPAMAI
jgi:hypothetical protein